MIEGRRRLALLEHSLDPSTFRRLEAIGVAPGWRCLDVGAGGHRLRVAVSVRGPTVFTAIDLDARFLRALDYANLDVREENVVDADFPSGTFDSVHTRWTLLHIPERERVLQSSPTASRLPARCSWKNPTRFPCGRSTAPGSSTLSSRVFEIVQSRGSHPDWSRDLPFKMASLGLGNLRAEGETPYFHGPPARRVLADQLGPRARRGAESGADVTQWDRELAELDDPTRLFVSPMTLAVSRPKPDHHERCATLSCLLYFGSEIPRQHASPSTTTRANSKIGPHQSACGYPAQGTVVGSPFAVASFPYNL